MDYEQELKASIHIINNLQKIYPALTRDEAYLLFRNSVSSINTYSIHETYDE